MLDTHTNLASLLKDPSLLVTQAYLAGEWVDGDNEARFEVVNPARGDVIAKVADISHLRNHIAAGRVHNLKAGFIISVHPFSGQIGLSYQEAGIFQQAGQVGVGV